MDFGQQTGNLPRDKRDEKDCEDYDDDRQGLLAEGYRRVVFLGRPDQIKYPFDEPADRLHIRNRPGVSSASRAMRAPRSAKAS